MTMEIFSAKNYLVLKATIQKTGRLGFSAATSNVMGISTSSYFLIGKDEAIDADLIMVLLNRPSKDAFRVMQSGPYYYLKTTALFDMLRYDYKSARIFFDVKRDSSYDKISGGETYLLKQRKSKGRKPRKG